MNVEAISKHKIHKLMTNLLGVSKPPNRHNHLDDMVSHIALSLMVNKNQYINNDLFTFNYVVVIIS